MPWQMNFFQNEASISGMVCLSTPLMAQNSLCPQHQTLGAIKSVGNLVEYRYLN